MPTPWQRLKTESAQAYAAFGLYLEHGSIDAAWLATNPQQTGNGKRAPGQWTGWASKYEWVARATAYADHLAEQNRLLWEQRQRELQERDWQQADRMRRIVDEAQVMADQFLRSKTTTIPGVPTVVDADGNVIQHGTPTRQLITTALDIVAVSKVMLDASKQQRLATGQSTEHIELSGAALDAAIERLALGLAGLADGGQTQAAGTPATNESAGDGAAHRRGAPPASGDEALPG